MTVREREIANLVAAGLSNRDIADRLIEVAAGVGGRLALAIVAHARAIGDRDNAGLFAIAEQFEQLGALLSALPRITDS
ncbi:hypothetical protein [Mycolicibacterium sp. CBMA 361]|uniref:hypothetical protein n=1 Tax=Mycolicibacterium sp. CBMA 361 TaxID=2606610 RepID=UPI001EF05591|nr:hypothetical protein [Mycolicibacterium sp. CBMA 361]